MDNIIPKLVYQAETNECALACVSMLAETQGISAPLEALRERFPTSSHGTALSALCDILSELAIPAYPVAFDFDELAELPLPAILHYGASHYVLLAYRQGSYVCVMNPAIGEQLLPVAALKSEISGYAVVLDQEAPRTAQTAEKQPRTRRFRALECMSLKQTAAIPGIYKLMLLAFLVSLTLFIMPVMVSSAINNVFSSGGKTEFPYFYYLLAFVVSTLLAFIVRSVTERFIKRFVVMQSVSGFARLLNNTLSFFEKRSPGEIYSRFSSWQMAAAQKIELDNGLRVDWVVGVIALAVMCYISPLLAGISAIGVTLMGLVSVWAIFRDRHYTQQIQVKSAEQSDFLLETIQGFATLKSAGLNSQRQAAFAGYALSLFDCRQKQKVYEQVKSSLYQLIGSLEMVFFMLLALPLLKDNRISLGEFFAYSFVRQIFTAYITQIFFSVLQKNQLHVIDTRAADLFPPVREEAAGDVLPPVRFSQQLSYRALQFAYDPGKPVLDHVSLTVRQGETLAIVGESGAGKSTLLKVITGLIEPQGGEILADGHPVSSRQAQKLFFLQSQEDILFNTSVLQNITLFDREHDAQKQLRIDKSLRGLNLTEVIDRLPGKQNALIRESHPALSLGQRQRLMLARAMYSDCPVMVLDEPTANLDEETAQQVMQTLISHCREYGKTLITVTHSETALSLFDRVCVMRNGRVAATTGAVISVITPQGEPA
ncbi:ATP-binding cassette subfamily B protein RaxB [Rahnella sp. BIGb0236]|uniref:peptidase domain-containing ABC transporter n=1 Tax=Rahnella sp. BIGb0236 TaxID=2485117 RepID=UPI00105E8CA4|nr:ATP-binding cassette domain-containing protein [Rahnella sp. BIGb0236]TDS84315.1 ATP-binding cassette subfamily B protein RaxB [Rahnella sp. BIGb0236]